MVTGFLEKYVRTTLRKVWQELDFLNLHTDGAFKHLRQKTNTDMKKVASKIDKDGNESGWKSTIEGITADTPDKLRGDRVDNIYFEESGNHRSLIETYSRAHALVDILGSRVGNRFVFGTSGEQGPQLAGLKTMFFNPKSYTILPYLNRHMANGEPQLTGYFIPSYSMWLGKPVGSGFDDRGVVYIEKAKKYYEDHWKTIDDPKALLIDKAEYCFTPEDAFVLEGSNRFDQELLVDQLHALTIHKTVELPKPARLSWGRTKDGEVDRDTRPVLEMIDKSPLEICELPILDEYGIPYSNLYVAAADSIDADSTTSTGQTDVSEFCIVILRRQFGLQPPKIVAIYKERPKHIQTAFDNAMKLCQFFNCKLLFEATRVSIKTYFEHHKKLNLLMTRPRATSNTTTRTNLKQYGVPATPAIIDHQLDLIEQFIVDYSTGIQFPQMIDELMRYSYENKRKFDIVAALGIVLLAEEEMTGRVAKPSQPYKPNWGISYVKNQYGQIEITTGDDKKREIGTGGSRDHIMPVQTSVYQSPGGSFWRR